MINRDANDINIILNKYEDDMREHSNANDTIDMLEDKVDKLQETLNYFKELWKKFIKFLQDKLFYKNKYDELIE